MSERSAIRARKREHLDICRRQPVEFQRKTPWFECVEFVHQAAPEFGLGEVDLSTEFLGRKLAAPFLIAAMTGGAPEALKINRALARIASAKGIGLGLGSQRAMLEQDAVAATYRVRDVAPGILLLGNIGFSQAAALKEKQVRGLIERVGADGLCVHLNAAMEMAQPGGDASRGRTVAAVGRLAGVLGERLIVKETGCGLSRETAARLRRQGVRVVDVAGAGGTSWVRVENFRRGAPAPGLDEMEEWGIPTAASLMEMTGLRLRVIASGGLRSGLDLAKSIALGASLGSAALPVLTALDRGGPEEAARWLDSVIAGLRAAMFLTGCRNLEALRRAPLVVTGPLREWAEQRGVWRKFVERPQ